MPFAATCWTEIFISSAVSAEREKQIPYGNTYITIKITT